MEKALASRAASHQSSVGDRSGNEVLHRFLLLLTVLVCVGPYLWFTWSYHTNIPFIDDFDSLLLFALNFQNAESFQDKLSLVFSQHNEHRIVGIRVAALISLAIHESVNFAWLSRFSLVFLIGFLLLVVFSTSKSTALWQRCLFAVVFTCFLFQFNNFESVLWPTVALPNCSVLFFAALHFFCLLKSESSPPRVRLSWCLLAYLAFVAAIFSQGNGIALLPASLICLALMKRFRDLTLLLLFGGGIIALYFWGYSSIEAHPDPLEALPKVWRNLSYSLYFLGAAAAQVFPGSAFYIGILAYLALAVLTFRRFFLKNLCVFGTVVFLFGSIWVNALSRSEFGVDYAMHQPRYFMYSGIALGLLVLGLLVEFLPRDLSDLSTQKFLSWAFSLLLVSNSFYFLWSTGPALSKWEHYRASTRAGLRQWCQTGVGLNYPWADRAEDIMTRSIESGVYQPAPRLRKLCKKRLG